MAEEQGQIPYIPAVIGFLLGGVFLLLLDRVIPVMNEKTRILRK
jgi:zinc transporter, ZIP family